MGQAKNWNEEEIEYLENNWGTKSVRKIAKALGRTPTGIRLKATRLGLGNIMENGDFITLQNLLKALGLENSASHYKEKFIRYGCPIRYKESASGKKSHRVVYFKAFLKWAEENKNILNFSRFEKGNLGWEPEWVDIKRRADSKDPSKLNHNREWTKGEDEKLIFMCKIGRYTYEDIAIEINRTEAAIKRRLRDLGEKSRPIYRENHKSWTIEEDKKLLELHSKGYSSYAMSKELGKSQFSIPDRIKMLMEGEKMTKTEIKMLRYLKKNTDRFMNQTRAKTIRELQIKFKTMENLDRVYNAWKCEAVGTKDIPTKERDVTPPKKKVNDKFVFVYKK